MHSRHVCLQTLFARLCQFGIRVWCWVSSGGSQEATRAATRGYRSLTPIPWEASVSRKDAPRRSCARELKALLGASCQTSGPASQPVRLGATSSSRSTRCPAGCACVSKREKENPHSRALLAPPKSANRVSRRARRKQGIAGWVWRARDGAGDPPGQRQTPSTACAPERTARLG